MLECGDNYMLEILLYWFGGGVIGYLCMDGVDRANEKMGEAAEKYWFLRKYDGVTQDYGAMFGAIMLGLFTLFCVPYLAHEWYKLSKKLKKKPPQA